MKSSFEGRWWQCSKVPIVLRPLQQPHPPLWYACGTPDAAVWPARNDISIVCNAPVDRVAAIVARYRAERAGTGPEPRLGLSRAIVIADTRRKRWRPPGAAGGATTAASTGCGGGTAPARCIARVTDDFAETQAAGMGFAGTVAEVRDALLRQVAETGANYLVSRFAFGDLSAGGKPALRHPVRRGGDAGAGRAAPQGRLTQQPRRTPWPSRCPKSNPEALRLDPRPLDRLCTIIEQHVAEGHHPGAQLAVARHGKLALFRSFGDAASAPPSGGGRASSS